MADRIHFHFVTLFPQTIETWLTTSIMGRAARAGLFDYSLIQLRDYAHNKHRSVDDTTYGGGGGMVLSVEPLAEAVEALFSQWGKEKCEVIYFSPVGARLSQTLLESCYARPKNHLILVCGHYEGVDERFIEGWVDQQISLGDFVITGGEIAALAFCDALVRQMDGALGAETGAVNESFRLRSGRSRLLEYPQYTKPAEFRGRNVPEVLLSGDHQKIDAWRQQMSLSRTQQMRPDLLIALDKIPVES